MGENTVHITLKDIAAAMNLSVNTISCALKGTNNISPETIIKVRKKAEEMGYIYNSIAVSMRTGFTKTIAIILGDIANAYFAIMVNELERLIRSEGYTAIIMVTEEDAEIEYQAIQTAISRNVDGIILFPTSNDEKGINIMRKVNVPFILLGRHLEDRKMDFVVSDDISGGYLATRYLLDKGHRHIFCFAGPDAISSARERTQGYIKAMTEASFKNFNKYIIHCDIMINEYMDRLIVNVFKNNKNIEAIFTYNDIIAFRIIRIIRKLKISMPDIVGYDNIQSKIDFGFDIPSINIHKTRMSEIALKQLFNIIRSPRKNAEFLNEVVPVDLCFY